MNDVRNLAQKFRQKCGALFLVSGTFCKSNLYGHICSKPSFKWGKMKPRSLSVVEKRPFGHDHIFPTFDVGISSPVTSINWPLVFDLGMQLIGPYEYSRP